MNCKYHRIKRACLLAMGVLLGVFLLSGCESAESINLRVGAMKGPTSMGVLSMMGEGSAYEFHMATAADELVPLMAKGELDIALLPANVAAVLYQKMQGEIAVIDINTLGVLYFVTGNEEIKTIEDFRGQTIYLTGKGTTPEAGLRYVLEANGLGEGDVTLEFKSEPTEVAAILAQEPEAVALLPQPFVTVALSKNEALDICMDLNEEWSSLSAKGEGMVTGVTVVRKEVLESHPKAVEQFLEDHKGAVDALASNPEAGAQLAVDAGILPNVELAIKAIPRCNIVCITGSRMQELLSGYLEVLAAFDLQLLGGALPAEDFYYIY